MAIGSRNRAIPTIQMLKSSADTERLSAPGVTCAITMPASFCGAGNTATAGGGGVRTGSCVAIGASIPTGGIRVDATGKAASAANVTASSAWRSDARLRCAIRVPMSPKAAIAVALTRVKRASDRLPAIIMLLIPISMVTFFLLADAIDLAPECVQILVGPRGFAHERHHHLSQ